MANRYAVATGNWSDTATWDGGTLPTAGDVVRPNGFTVTIDVDVTVDELTNDASAPAVAGGSFVLNGGVTVNANILTRAIISGTYNLVVANYGNGLSTINGNVLHLNGAANSSVLRIIGSAGGVLVVNGDVYTDVGAGSNPIQSIFCQGDGNGFKLQINGLLSGSLKSTNAFSNNNGVLLQSNYIVESNGVIQGQQAPSSSTTFFSNGIRIEGVSNVVIVNGIVKGGDLKSVFNLSRSGIYAPDTVDNEIRIYGLAEATLLPAVIGGLVRYMSGAVVMDGTTMKAIQPRAHFVNAVGDDVQFILPVDAIDTVSLYTAGLLTGYPLENKVEDGTVFGPSSEFEGTLLPWSPAFAQALANAQRDLQLPQILSAITQP